MESNDTIKQRYNDRARESLILSMKGCAAYSLAIIAAFWWVATQSTKDFDNFARFAILFALLSTGNSLIFWFIDTRLNYLKSRNIEDSWSKRFDRVYFWPITATYLFLFAAAACSVGYIW